MKNLGIRTGIALLILFSMMGIAYANPVDLTNGNKASDVKDSGQIAPEKITVAATILDDFNRSDGPIGPAWTNQAGTFMVSGMAAVGGPMALATYNGVTSNVVEADVQSVGTGLEYVGIDMGYADINNNLFLKVQNQDGDDRFEWGACYVGNGGRGFGLGFFPLSSPFTKAHMRAELNGNTVTITFENIDGGSGTQTYVCSGAPATGGNGVGIVGYASASKIDNFAAAIASPLPSVSISTNKAVYAPGETIQLKLNISNPTTNTYPSNIALDILWPGGTGMTFLNTAFTMTPGMKAVKVFPIPIPNSIYVANGDYKFNAKLTFSGSSATSSASFTIRRP